MYLSGASFSKEALRGTECGCCRVCGLKDDGEICRVPVQRIHSALCIRIWQCEWEETQNNIIGARDPELGNVMLYSLSPSHVKPSSQLCTISMCYGNELLTNGARLEERAKTLR